MRRTIRGSLSMRASKTRVGRIWAAAALFPSQEGAFLHADAARGLCLRQTRAGPKGLHIRLQKGDFMDDALRFTAGTTLSVSPAGCGTLIVADGWPRLFSLTSPTI